MVLLLLLSYCWTAQLIRAVVHATVAGTVGSWYFLSPRVPPNPTARALKRALTTSLGSLCLGALVAAALQTLRTVARGLSSRGGGRLRSCCLCLLGFIDVLVRFFNEFAYTQIALYGKNFTRASRDTWTLLVHHSGVDALVQKDFVGSAMALGSLVGGMFTCLLVGAWARATLGVDGAAWWQARHRRRIAPPAPAHLSHLVHLPSAGARRGLPRRVLGAVRRRHRRRGGRHCSLRLLCRGSEPAADARLDAVRNLHRAPARAAAGDGGVLRQHGGGGIAIGRVTREYNSAF